MTAVLDILTRAVRLLGAVAQGTPLKPGDAKDALIALNAMIESWNIDSLVVYTRNFDTYNIVPSKPVYTIGPSGDIAAVPQLRPTNIERAILNVLGTNPTIDLDLDILNDAQWAAINVKSLQGTLPTKLYSTGDYPEMRLFLWPIPTQSNKLTLWTWNQLSSVTDINGELELPPGYERAIIYNLAIELSSEYNTVPSMTVMQIATDSLAKIKRLNAPDILMECDPAILSAPAAFNWLIGK